MRALSFETTPDERALLGLLGKKSVAGERLIAHSGFDERRFEAASDRLWKAFMLKGALEDGCCGAPCGVDCVSAFAPDRVWKLTAAGQQLAELDAVCNIPRAVDHLRRSGQ